MAETFNVSYDTTPTELANRIHSNLLKNDKEEHVVEKVSEDLYNIESKLLNQLSLPEEKRDQGLIEKLQVKYKRAMRVYEMMQELMRNAHEVMMRVIHNFRVN